jgi:hypothetical protein
LHGCPAGSSRLDLHTAAFAGGAAPVLLLRTSRIAVWRAGRLTVAGSPYLDAHGEGAARALGGRGAAPPPHWAKV